MPTTLSFKQSQVTVQEPTEEEPLSVAPGLFSVYYGQHGSKPRRIVVEELLNSYLDVHGKRLKRAILGSLRGRIASLYSTSPVERGNVVSEHWPWGKVDINATSTLKHPLRLDIGTLMGGQQVPKDWNRHIATSRFIEEEIETELPDFERTIVDSAYDQHRAEIRSYAQLPKGWDTYSAEPPKALAIELALNFISSLERRSVEIDWVAPTNDDSVMVVIKTRNGKQEWDFYGDGDVAVMTVNRAGEKQYFDVAHSDIEGFLDK